MSTPLIDLRCYDICNHLQSIHFVYLFPQQRKLMGSLQPRIAPVYTGANAGSSSTRFRRRFQMFWRRSAGLWCRARSGTTGFQRRFRRRFGEALVQSQVRFNRVPEKVPEKVWDALVQSQVRFNRICGHLTGDPAGVFPALGFASHASERFVKIKRCGCWGYHRSLFFGWTHHMGVS